MSHSVGLISLATGRRDLDEKVEALQAEIAQKKRSNKHYDLESNVTRLVSLADEKVRAMQNS